MKLILISILMLFFTACGKKATEEQPTDDTISISQDPVDDSLESAGSKSDEVESDPLANITDGENSSREEEPQDPEEEAEDITVIVGCMDPLAFNYDAAATEDSGACVAIQLGCTDSSMFNYNDLANVDDGSCIASVMGCTDTDAFNFNAAANTDDGSCIAKVLGCTDSSYMEYDDSANTDDGSCAVVIVEGCTDSGANNYNAAANVDDGSCNAVAIEPTDSLPLADVAGTGSSLSVGEGDVQVTAGTEGVLGGNTAYSFDGNDMLAIGNSDTFNTGGPYYGKTMTVVFRTGADTTGTQMIFEEGGSVRGMNLYIQNGTLYYNIYNIISDGGNAPWGPVAVSTSIQANTDYVATLYYDQTAGIIRGYLNGSSIGEASGCGILYAHSDAIGMGAINSDAVLHDGTVILDGGSHFSGLIANFIYYSEAISMDQLNSIHDEQISTFLP